MRCPKCGLEINPLSERCTNCGTSAKFAKPDGDTMTRVRRQIAVVRGEREEPDQNYTDASFSPVMKFERTDGSADPLEGDNPAENFEEQRFTPVDLDAFMREREETPEERRHRELSAEIRGMVRNKEDDLLAEYYFSGGMSYLERYQQARETLRKEASDKAAAEQENTSQTSGGEEEMSEAARRLNTFPDESGLDKLLTVFFEWTDRLGARIRSFFQKHIRARAAKVYRRFDKKTAPLLDPVLDKMSALRFGGLARKKREEEAERYKTRRLVWSVCGVLLAVLLCTGIFVASLFTDSINGKWIVSYDVNNRPDVIMEFRPGGGAAISVRSEDGWHIHKQGKYKTKRQNGHDLLTISYEDGTVSRLYYIIEGKKGTFINVETNVKVTYDLQ